MNKTLKLLIPINALVGLFVGFLFYYSALWGISDDIDRSKVAWGHLAFRHFTESLQYAFYIALICLGLSWFTAYSSTLDSKRSTKWAVGLGLLTLTLSLIGAAIGDVQFYFERPIGM